ncbi:MAG: hypothetical protein KGM42_17285 [Hyphomicrobiales bacterium]|nr:hypothetical protein [Hyphomicrobiales bacterium]
MTFIEFEHRVLPRLILPMLGGLLLLGVVGRTGAQAAARNTFVIKDSEGYGITECLTGGKACGRVVADAWCESHGLGPSLAFGRVEDVTGATDIKADATATHVTPGSVIVTCDD